MFKTKYIRYMLIAICTCFYCVFNHAFADDHCLYHLQHDTTCTTTQLECLHKCDENCNVSELNCIEEHEHLKECYMIENSCSHTHLSECYKETDCTHICSYCNDDLYKGGSLEEYDDGVIVNSHLMGTYTDDQLYYYLKLDRNLLNKIDLEMVNGSYIVVSEDNQVITLNPLYFSDDEQCVYLKYQQDYETNVVFKLPLKLDDKDKNVEISLLMASSLDEEIKSELSKVTLNSDIITYAIRMMTSSSTPSVQSSGTDFSEHIDEVEILIYHDGKFHKVTDGNLSDGDSIVLKIHFSMPEGVVTLDNKVIYYQLPETIIPDEDMEGTVYDNDTAQGKYTISKDGLITITFFDEYANGEPIDGYIQFDGSIHLKDGTHIPDRVLIGEIEFTINPVVTPKNYDLDVNKQANKESNIIHYTIKASSVNGTEASIKMSDKISGGAFYDKNSFVLVNQDGTQINVSDYITFNNDMTEFTLDNLPMLNENGSYTLTYDAKIDPTLSNDDGVQNISNRVSASSGNIVDTSNTYTPVSGQRIHKSGYSTRGEGLIHWKITLNDVTSGDVVKDKLPDGLLWEGGKATITPSVNGSSEIIFNQNSDGTYSYTLPEGIDTPTNYVIEFETKVTQPGDFDSATQFQNIAELETDEKTYKNPSTVTYYNDKAVDKNLLTKVNETASGTYYQWNAVLTLPNLDDVEYSYVDTLLTNSSYQDTHYFDETFHSQFKLTDSDGKVLPSECYSITFYDKDGNVVDDLSTHKAISFQIDFDNEKLKNVDTNKIKIDYQSYAKYSLKPGEWAYYSNKGKVTVDNNPENPYDDKVYEDSSGDTYETEAALDKVANGIVSQSTDGAKYKWTTTLNVPSVSTLNQYQYIDILSSSDETSHYIKDKVEFLNNLSLKDQNGNILDSSLYSVIFVDKDGNEITDDNKLIQGFIIDFNEASLKQLSPQPSKIVIEYQSDAKYNMMPGESVTYTNTGKIKIDDNTYQDTDYVTHKKDDALNKKYTHVINQSEDGAQYYFRSVLTYPNIEHLNQYIYTDTVTTSDELSDHYFKYNDIDLSITDENSQVLSSEYYSIVYLDKQGNEIIDPANEDKIYGYKIIFNVNNLNKLQTKPQKLYITYKTHADYRMYPNETVIFKNKANVLINTQEYEKQADVSHKREDALNKSLQQIVDESRNDATYKWNVTLTPPHIDNLEKYEYIDILTSDSDHINHYIDKDRFDLTLTDQGGNKIDSDIYQIIYLDSNQQEVTIDSDELITGFKIIFDTTKISDITKININYSSYAKYDMNAGETVIYKNSGLVNINDKPYESIVTKPHTKDKLLKKMNGIFSGELKDPSDEFYAYKNKRKIFIPSFTEETITISREESNVLYYAIFIKPDDSNEDIVVKDTLPKGTQLITESEDINLSPYVGYYFNQWNFNDWGSWTSEGQVTLDRYFSYDYDAASNVVTYTLTKEAKKVYSKYDSSSMSYIAIVYALEIVEPPAGIEITKYYNNTVVMGDDKVTSTQRVKEEAKYLDKVGYQEDNIIHYQLIVNPSGSDLVKDKDTIFLIDEIEDASSFDYISFVPSSLKVYQYDVLTQTIGQELDNSLYKFTYDNALLKLTVELPDEIPCVVKYDYLLDALTKDKITITNKARIEGITESDTEDDTDYERPSSLSQVSKKKFNIFKVDSQDYAVTLPNAQFTLYKYNESADKYWEVINDNLQSDEKGKFTLSTISDENDQSNSAILENVLYRLCETKPPPGYMAEDKWKDVYFIVKPDDDTIDIYGSSGGISPTVIQNTGLSLDQIKVLQTNGGNYYVENIYTSLTTKKLWLDYDGTTLSQHPSSVTIKLHQLLLKDVVKMQPCHTVTLHFIEISQNKETKTITYNDVKDSSDFSFNADWGLDQAYVRDDVANVTHGEFIKNNETQWKCTYFIEDIKEDRDIYVYSPITFAHNETVRATYTHAKEYIDKDIVTDTVIDEFVLNDSNNWTYTIEDMERTTVIDGTTYYYYYSVEEVDVPDGYNVRYDGNGIQSGNIVVSNIKEKEPVKLPDVGSVGSTTIILMGLTLIGLSVLLSLRSYIIDKNKR